MRLLIILLLLTLNIQCIEHSIEHINNNETLERIYLNDQKYRIEAQSIPDSSERYRYLLDTIPKIDMVNQKEIFKYLNEYGYPDTTNYTREAQQTPWLVLQHSTDIEKRNEYYKYFEDGFEKGALTNGELWLYLNRTYLYQFGEIHEIDNTHEQNFNERIPILKNALEINDEL